MGEGGPNAPLMDIELVTSDQTYGSCLIDIILLFFESFNNKSSMSSKYIKYKEKSKSMRCTMFSPEEINITLSPSEKLNLRPFDISVSSTTFVFQM